MYFDFVTVLSGHYDGIIVHINKKKHLLPVIVVFFLFKHLIDFLVWISNTHTH